MTHWERENYNRNYLEKGIKEANENDYIMISDLDEIPKIDGMAFDTNTKDEFDK